MRNEPMKMQTADAGRVACRDCVYRDKAMLVILGEKTYVGVTRDTCLIYDGKKGNWKPTRVILRNEMCEYYKKDEKADHYWVKGR